MEPTILDIKISQNIRKIRDLKGLSQEFVASCLSLSQPAYSKIEQGKTHLNADLKERLAQIMEVDEKWFDDFSDNVIFNNNNCTNAGNYNNYVGYDSVEKIEEMYKNLLLEKDKQINLLTDIIKTLKK